MRQWSPVEGKIWLLRWNDNWSNRDFVASDTLLACHIRDVCLLGGGHRWSLLWNDGVLSAEVDVTGKMSRASPMCGACDTWVDSSSLVSNLNVLAGKHRYLIVYTFTYNFCICVWIVFTLFFRSLPRYCRLLIPGDLLLFLKHLHQDFFYSSWNVSSLLVFWYSMKIQPGRKYDTSWTTKAREKFCSSYAYFSRFHVSITNLNISHF